MKTVKAAGFGFYTSDRHIGLPLAPACSGKADAARRARRAIPKIKYNKSFAKIRFIRQEIPAVGRLYVCSPPPFSIRRQQHGEVNTIFTSIRCDQRFSTPVVVTLPPGRRVCAESRRWMVTELLRVWQFVSTVRLFVLHPAPAFLTHQIVKCGPPTQPPVLSLQSTFCAAFASPGTLSRASFGRLKRSR